MIVVKTRCPACKNIFKLNTAILGTKRQCVFCSHTFEVEAYGHYYREISEKSSDLSSDPGDIIGNVEMPTARPLPVIPSYQGINFTRYLMHIGGRLAMYVGLIMMLYTTLHQGKALDDPVVNECVILILGGQGAIIIAHVLQCLRDIAINSFNKR